MLSGIDFFSDLTTAPKISIIGVLLLGNIWFIYRISVGKLVSRKEVEHAEQVADVFKEAWETAQTIQHTALDLTQQLTVTAVTMEKVLDALRPEGLEDDAK